MVTCTPWTPTVTPLESADSDEPNPNPLNAYLAALSIDGDDGRVLRLQTLKLGP